LKNTPLSASTVPAKLFKCLAVRGLRVHSGDLGLGTVRLGDWMGGGINTHAPTRTLTVIHTPTLPPTQEPC